MHQVVAEPDRPDQVDRLRPPGQHRLGAQIDRHTLDLITRELAPEPRRPLEHGDLRRIRPGRQRVRSRQPADPATNHNHPAQSFLQRQLVRRPRSQVRVRLAGRPEACPRQDRLRRGVAVGRPRPQPRQPVLRRSELDDRAHRGRGESLAAGLLRDPVAELSRPVLEVDQVHPADHRTGLVHQDVELADPGLLLGQAGRVNGREGREVLVTAVPHPRGEVLAVLQLEREDGVGVRGGETLQRHLVVRQVHGRTSLGRTWRCASGPRGRRPAGRRGRG